MQDELVLIRNQVLPDSQNYDVLRKAGIQHIQDLASKLWTDYNPSDPGITLLEMLCYGITDLGYRTAYDLKDLLTKSHKGAPVPPQFFHQAREILSNGPVTFRDLAKVIVDVEGVRNARVARDRSIRYWLDKEAGKLVNQDQVIFDVEGNPTGRYELLEALNGLLNVFIEFEEFVEDLKLGLEDRDICGGETLKGKYEDPEVGSMRIRVERDILLKSVAVYADEAGKVVIRLLNSDESEVIRTLEFEVEYAQTKTVIPVNWVLVPTFEEEDDFYVLDAKGSGVNLYMNINGIREDCLLAPEGIAEILPGERKNPIKNHYYYFYDITLDFPEPGSGEYDAKAVLGLDDYEKRNQPGEFTMTDGKSIWFDVERQLTLDAVHIYARKKGKVLVEVKNMDGKVIGCEEVVVKKIDTKTRVELNCPIAPCQNYRIEARSEDGEVELYANTLNADGQPSFPFIEPGVLLIMGGMSEEYLEQEYYFFYEWEISFKKPYGENIPSFPFTPAMVCNLVRDRVLTLRNLDEDLIHIKNLLPEDIAVCADIELTNDADVEEVMAEILYCLEAFVRPPVKFHTLEEMQEKGKTTDVIFEGPLLDHGFIDDDEFPDIEKKTPFRASDIINKLMDIKGITAVKNLSMLSYIDEVLREQEKWELCPAEDDCRLPNFSPDKSNFIFYKNDLPFYADIDKARQILFEREAEDIRLKHKEHEDNLPIPVGEDMEVGDHYPVQNDLPLNYLVGQYRVPASETAQRKAQARQLKAFLLFFEQMFANYLAQLDHINELFSWAPTGADGIVRTYFTQKLHEHEIADLPELYVDYQNLQTRLDDIIEDEATAHNRKLRFLEHLIARFGESFTDYSLLMFRMFEDEAYVSETLIEDKQKFLKDYPRISSERGQGYDYRYPLDRDNLTGLQRRVYRKLGFCPVKRKNLAGHRLVIRDENPEGVYFVILDDEMDEVLFQSIACPSRAAMIAMIDFLFRLALEEGRLTYRVEKCEHEWQLIVDCEEGEKDQLVGILKDEASQEEVLCYLERYAQSEGFHVVEHILLRKRQPSDPFLPIQYSQDEGCTNITDPYSFHISVILPAWSRRFRNLNFRALVEKTIREETPAHIFPRICWIGHEQMRVFEECLEKWECELAGLSAEFSGCRNCNGENPGLTPPDYRDYQQSLKDLIDKLNTLEMVYPPARIHDCDEASSDMPQIILGNSNLDTLG